MRFCLVAILCLLCWGCVKTPEISKTDSARRELFVVWENLNWQQDLRNYSTICSVIDTVLELSQSLPAHERKWYYAASYLSRARAEVRLDRFADARRDILLALDSGYRNDALIKFDEVLLNGVGKSWFDSVIAIWEVRQADKQKRWKAQEAVFLQPQNIAKDEKRPLIIALHGGNGSHEEFASHFLTVPDEIKGMMAFPPGPIKYSSICHSWPPDTQYADSLILAVIDSAKRTGNIDDSKVYLLGYSQGGSTAIGFAFRHPNIVKGAILFSSFTNEKFSEAIIQNAFDHGLKFYSICSATDVMPFLSSMRDLSAQCKRAGIPFYYEERGGILHGVPLDIEDQLATAWQWLQQPALGAK
jgi:pimeloyl-ACP methyl ester carboxylesterase